MSHLTYYDYPNFGTRTRAEVGSSQAVRYSPGRGDILEISGQGGWDRLTEQIPHDDLPRQIAQAFDNVQHTLEQAGGRGWTEVFAVRIYVVGWTEEVIKGVVGGLKRWCPDHQPVLTVVGVGELYAGMKIEIEVKAQVVDEKGN